VSPRNDLDILALGEICACVQNPSKQQGNQRNKTMVQFLDELRAPCTSPQSGCEESWFLASAGVCDVATGECLCPDGYSGRDDWASFNDCRINEDLRRGLWIGALVINCFAFLSSIFAFAFFAHRFGIQKPDVVGRGTGISGRSTGTGSNRLSRKESASSSASKGFAENSPRPSDGSWVSPTEKKKFSELTRKYRTRQRWTMQSIGFSICSGIGGFLYIGGILGGLYRFDRPFLLDLGLFFSLLGFVFQLWSGMLIFFQALPNLRLYGKLFGVDSILIRKPYLIRQATRARLILFSFMGFLLLIALRHFTEFSVDQLDILDTVTLVSLAVMLLDYTVFATILGFVLNNLYTKLRSLSTEAVENGSIPRGSEKKFDRAIRTSRILTGLLILVSPLAVIVPTLAAFVKPVRTRMHISLAVILIIGNLGTMLNNFVLVFRYTQRSRKKKEKEVSPLELDDNQETEEKS